MYITKCLDLFTRKERKMKGRNKGRKRRGRREREEGEREGAVGSYEDKRPHTPVYCSHC